MKSCALCREKLFKQSEKMSHKRPALDELGFDEISYSENHDNSYDEIRKFFFHSFSFISFHRLFIVQNFDLLSFFHCSLLIEF